ncbi:MAG: ATP-dependent helicase, partial [Oscillospiraceae bacterium]|nr:ATP-dependent helicase [Oscillospiraceae bacterium]
HKLASLLLLEDVKKEQLLMLTFSRAAATEFKMRLIELIGSSANYVEIKTFHSYCFDLLGKIGSLNGADDVVKNAIEMIRNGEVEPRKISKSVLVIDEAQDMDKNEFELVRLLMQNNDDMRLVAVGDDDQNIYEFRGSSSEYMKSLIEDYGAVKYEMTENYRSKAAIISLGNAFVTTIHNRMKSNPIVPVHADLGIVSITHHRGKHMGEAVVRHIIETRSNRKCCVLTNKNEEALQLLALLEKNGEHAKLIQSSDSFHLYNLVEIRFFLKSIDRELNSPVISDDLWKKAKKRLFKRYAESTALEICKNLISSFETLYPSKYRSDLDEFIKSSSYEDFYNYEADAIYVSTIHKSKGREFDVVYMMLDGNTAENDAEKRKLYVGMTRARDELYIHCNTQLFSTYTVPGVEYFEDTNIYEGPTEVFLQLTLKDVVLDFFKNKKETVFKLRSGSELSLDDDYLSARLNGRSVHIVKFSNVCRKKVQDLQRQGYKPFSAEVRFIVAWKGEDDSEEAAVVLPDLHFRK